jgi:hypothetical protein
MTENEARQKAVELDHRYRLLLRSTDQLDGRDNQILADIKRKFAACEQEFDYLLHEHPQLFQHLEAKYKLANAGKLETKSLWPKKDAPRVPAAADLINFAYEEDLDLFGAPKEKPHFPRDSILICKCIAGDARSRATFQPPLA